MSLGTWRVTDTIGGVHSIPEDDLIWHTESEACFCSPDVEIMHVRGSYRVSLRKLVVHNAMDDRE